MRPLAELPPGGETAPVDGAELVVTLSGEIDLGHRARLSRLGRRLAGHDGPVVIDLADVTFADGTLAGFLAEILSRESVVVEAPTRLSREFLRLYGVDCGVRRTGRTGSPEAPVVPHLPSSRE